MLIFVSNLSLARSGSGSSISSMSDYEYRAQCVGERPLVRVPRDVIRAPTPPPVIQRVVERAPTPEPDIVERVSRLYIENIFLNLFNYNISGFIFVSMESRNLFEIF